MSNTRRPTNAQSGQSATRGTQAVIAVVVIVCIVAVSAIAFFLNRDGDDEASDAGGQVRQSDPVPTEPSQPQPPGECAEPPAPPASPKTYPKPPDPAIAEDTTWVATVTTNCGDIVLELDGAAAPQTVASFLTLSEDGYYDDSPCHRLTTQGIFVLQCGDPTGSGSGNPGYGYGIENAPPDGAYPTGTLAMARSTDPNSNGGQFFIVYQDTMLPVEGGGYTIFGTVTEGLDIVAAIAAQGDATGAGDGAPVQPISIVSIAVEKA